MNSFLSEAFVWSFFWSFFVKFFWSFFINFCGCRILKFQGSERYDAFDLLQIQTIDEIWVLKIFSNKSQCVIGQLLEMSSFFYLCTIVASQMIVRIDIFYVCIMCDDREASVCCRMESGSIFEKLTDHALAIQW